MHIHMHRSDFARQGHMGGPHDDRHLKDLKRVLYDRQTRSETLHGDLTCRVECELQAYNLRSINLLVVIVSKQCSTNNDKQTKQRMLTYIWEISSSLTSQHRPVIDHGVPVTDFGSSTLLPTHSPPLLSLLLHPHPTLPAIVNPSTKVYARPLLFKLGPCSGQEFPGARLGNAVPLTLPSPFTTSTSPSYFTHACALVCCSSIQ